MSHAALARRFADFHDAPAGSFETGGLTFVATGTRAEAFRDLPDWDRWVRHVWFTKLGDAVVCSVDPDLALQVRNAYETAAWETLINPDAVVQAARPVDPDHPTVADAAWFQREILRYPARPPPRPPGVDAVERLAEGDPGADDYRHPEFDGGVFVRRAEDGTVVAHSGIKDHGDVQEIAVGTDPDHRRQGYGKAVVARAVAEILDREAVATYHPGPLSNYRSYALATSLGFEKVGEEMGLETDLHAGE